MNVQMQSFSDYPNAVKNNAKRGIALNQQNGNKCATQTGKVRAQQLAQGKPISLKTVKRMYSYLSRAEEYYDPNDTKACGTISYLLWGGKAALRWSKSILSKLDLSHIDTEIPVEFATHTVKLKDMNIIELVITEDDDFGVYAISLVDKPAMEEHWLALSEHELKLQTEISDKQILVGCAMVPKKPIYRKRGDEELYVHFSDSTIENIAHKFMKDYAQGKSTFMHEEELKGNVVVESWIVHSEKDKAYSLGLNPPIGSWMIAMQVTSKSLWDNEVKTGKIKGFSIEGNFADRMMVEHVSKFDEALMSQKDQDVDEALTKLYKDIKAILK